MLCAGCVWSGWNYMTRPGRGERVVGKIENKYMCEIDLPGTYLVSYQFRYQYSTSSASVALPLPVVV